MANPLSDLLPKDSQGPGMGNELKEKIRMQGEAGNSLRKPVAEPMKPVGAPSPMKPVQGPYGSNPASGEKRINVSGYQKPLGQMHKGGTVPKTGPYIMKEGEKVLTPEQHGQLKNAMSLASSALSHDDQGPQEPEMPKHLREMHIKELHTGGFHVQKHDGKGGMTEHGAPHNDAVVGHFMDHMSHPDEDEEAVEAGDHDMSAANAMSHDLGGK